MVNNVISMKMVSLTNRISVVSSMGQHHAVGERLLLLLVNF